MVVIKININSYASVHLAGSGNHWWLSDNKFHQRASFFDIGGLSQRLSAPIVGSARRVQINSNVIAFNFARIPPRICNNKIVDWAIKTSLGEGRLWISKSRSQLKMTPLSSKQQLKQFTNNDDREEMENLMKLRPEGTSHYFFFIRLALISHTVIISDTLGSSQCSHNYRYDCHVRFTQLFLIFLWGVRIFPAFYVFLLTLFLW